MKSIEENFTDWENDTFGFGYGTGEDHVLGALKAFLALCSEGKHHHQYDYQKLETALTPAVAWLLINTLAHDDKIEYGTSPRFGWLTKTGEELAEFVGTRTLTQLSELTCRDQDYIHCMPQHCNCDAGKDCRYSNPFWQIAPLIAEENILAKKKLTVTASRPERMEVEVEFPLFRKHDMDGETYTSIIYTRIEEDGTNFKIHHSDHYYGDEEFEFHIHKVAFNVANSIDYSLGRGEYACTRETFESVLAKAAAFVERFKATVGK